MPIPRRPARPVEISPTIRSARRWLLVLAYGISLCVQSGDLGSVDTVRRLRVAHSWWAGGTPVAAEDFPGFGVVGRDGVLHAFYGPGQSVLMLPADVVGTTLVTTFVASADDPLAEKLRIAFVSLAVFPVLTALAVLVAFELLRAIAFAPRAAALGALSLLLATSLLPYTQNNQENSLNLLLTLTAFLGAARWAGERRLAPLVLAGASIGANLLVRPVTAIDGAFVVLFGVGQLADGAGSPGAAFRRWRQIRGVELLAFTGTVGVAVLLDRLYHYHRFGTWWGTYFGIHGVQRRAREPWLPASFPFSADFSEGFLGVLFSPARSVLLFDAAMVVALVLVAVRWKDVAGGIRRFSLSSVGLLLATAAFYGKYYNWTGASAWGPRYCAVPSELLGMLAVPLLVQGWGTIRKPARAALVSILAYSVAVQLVSVLLWFNLEETQCRDAGSACFVIALRMRNLAGLALGHPPVGEGLSSRMLTPNFLPFLAAPSLGHRGALTVQIAWLALLAAIAVATVLVSYRWWRSDGPIAGRGRTPVPTHTT